MTPVRSPLAALAALVVPAVVAACTRTVDLGGSLAQADASAPAGDLDGSTVQPPTGDAASPDASTSNDASSPVDAATSPTFVFVTRSVYDANMGGLAGADQRCQASAMAAKLPGTYRAWLSDGTTDARNRITGTGPWLEVGTNKELFLPVRRVMGPPLRRVMGPGRRSERPG